MKRRHFIRGLGIGSAGLAATRGIQSGAYPAIQELDDFQYGGILSLEDVFSREGEVILRLEFADSPVPGPDGIIPPVRIRHGELVRRKTYFLDHVAVFWLKPAAEETRVTLGHSEKFSFTLGELSGTSEMSGWMDGNPVTAHFLLDREIGEVDLADLGIAEPGDEFSFVAMADPQGGEPDDKEGLKTRMKIHNAFIQESVALANNLESEPLFAMVIGDVCDDWGYRKDLARMNAFLSALRFPVLYGIGNHETLLRSQFGPGYNMEAFNHFLAAQKAMNGLEKMLYSFNAGMWHFVVWPDPLRDNFWETHPHYFDWLERDLEKHREMPAVVFQHIPSHPIGISPHINYAESVEVKRTFLDILARHGNVKYLLSGHVHIPVRASFKTAVTYKGINMISLPAAGYRPRAFGEEDFYGGPSQGIALVDIKGEKLKIRFKTVTEEVFEYPPEFREFKEASHPLWLGHAWQLPAASDFLNGDFSQGFDHWARRYVYSEDHDPSNLYEVRQEPGRTNGSSLYLYCRRRGYQAPGQDRLPQDINRISQAVALEKGTTPMLRFRYRIDGTNTDAKGFSGGYAWIEGFSGREKCFNMIYSAGKVWVNIGGKFGQVREYPHIQMALLNSPDEWHSAHLNIAEDYDRSDRGTRFADLQVDRLVVTLGVWNINDGDPQPFGIYFTGISLVSRPASSSDVDGQTVGPKPKEDEWWRNKLWPSVNIAGEHRYIIATQDPSSSPEITLQQGWENHLNG
jgi:hypothetical protein